jgi:hypothetical protein
MFKIKHTDDGRKDRPKHVQCYAKINNLRNWCIWLVLLQEYEFQYVRFIFCDITFVYIPKFTIPNSPFSWLLESALVIN